MFYAGWPILLIIGHQTQGMRRTPKKFVTDFNRSFDERKISGDEWEKTKAYKKLRLNSSFPANEIEQNPQKN